MIVNGSSTNLKRIDPKNVNLIQRIIVHEGTYEHRMYFWVCLFIFFLAPDFEGGEPIVLD